MATGHVDLWITIEIEGRRSRRRLRVAYTLVPDQPQVDQGTARKPHVEAALDLTVFVRADDREQSLAAAAGPWGPQWVSLESASLLFSEAMWRAIEGAVERHARRRSRS